MGDHAKLSPSAAKRWMTCAVAPRREKGLTSPSGPSALWGTACHKVLEIALQTMQRPYPEHARELWNALDPKAQQVGDFGEMAECAAVAYDYATQRQRDLNPAALRAETKVDPGAAISYPACYGTADTIIVSEDELEVMDLKSGAGVVVEPSDPQLLLYALGALIQYGFREAPFSAIRVTIVQPRAHHQMGPIRSIVYSKADLLAWCDTEFTQAVARAEDPNAVATPSEEGCRWCNAKATCPELSQASLSAAQAVFTVIPGVNACPTPGVPVTGREELANKLTRSPEELAPDEIRYILDHEKLITGWLSAVRTYAKDQGLAGNHIPGYKIVAGRKSRNWVPTEEEIVKATTNLKTAKGKRLGKTAMLETKLLSPAQAEKQIKPLVPEKTWEKIKGMIATSGGGPTLAPETDSRPALLTAATDVFSPIEPVEDSAPVDLDFLN